MTMNDRPDREIKHGRKLSQSGAEHVWGWGTPAGRMRAERRAHWIASAADLRPRKRVLEIGCGTGLFTQFFASSGAEILALDISEDLLRLARQRNLPKTVRFICSPFEELSANEPFDAVIGSSILHHLDIQLALKHIYRLLKPGSTMCFTEPNMLNPQILLQKNIPFLKARLGDSPDETAFFRRRLQGWMKDNHFVNIHITPFDWLHPATPSRLVPLVNTIGGYIEKLPILQEFAGSLFIYGQRPRVGAKEPKG